MPFSPPVPSRQRSQNHEAEEPEGSQGSKFPRRPSSPKSRNASRTGNRDRSDSAMAYRNIETNIDRLLEQLDGELSLSIGAGEGTNQGGLVTARSQAQLEPSLGSHRVHRDRANANVLGHEITRSQTGDVSTGPRVAPRTTSCIVVRGDPTRTQVPYTCSLWSLHGVDFTRGLPGTAAGASSTHFRPDRHG